MTKKARITAAELKRIAQVAKAEGVTVEVKVGDAVYTVSPFTPENKQSETIKKRVILL